MQQPQHPSYGYAVPALYHGASPSTGDVRHPTDTGGQAYSAYGATAGEGYAYPTNSQPPPVHNPYPGEYAPNFSSPEGPYAQNYENSFAGGGPSHSSPVGPPHEPYRDVVQHDTADLSAQGPVPYGNTNPNQQGPERPPQSEPQQAYGAPAPPGYGHAQSYGFAQPSGYEGAGGAYGTAVSSQPPAYAQGPSSYGGGYGGEQPPQDATHASQATGPGASAAAYGQSDAGHGAPYSGHMDQPAYSGYEATYGSAQQAPYISNTPPQVQPSYAGMHAQSDSGSKQPSYLNTRPQSSNPSYDSIQAGLSSLNLANPTKQPNYLDRADSGGNNLISFKSSYGGTIRYEAPRTSSHSAPRADSNGYGRSNASSELIDIVQGPGSSGGGGYRSGRAQPADTVEGEGGIQRYKVRLMPEDGSSGSAQQVQCQVSFLFSLLYHQALEGDSSSFL